MYSININISMKYNNIFPDNKTEFGEWHCFTQLQVPLMPGLIEDSWISYLFLHSICCDIIQHVAFVKLHRILMRKKNERDT